MPKTADECYHAPNSELSNEIHENVPGDCASDGGIGGMILEVARNILVSFRQGSIAVFFYFVIVVIVLRLD